jgi:twinkle protein
MLLPDDMDLSPYMGPLPEFKEVRPAWHFLEKVVGEFDAARVDAYPRLPWAKAHDDFSFRPGELTLYFGYSSHGKSAVTSQISLGLVSQGERVAVASLEVPVSKTLAKMARQAIALRSPSEDRIKSFMKWCNKRLWIFNHHGMIDPRVMIAVIRYTIEKFHVKHFVVDNLMKCIRGQDNYNAEKDFIDELIAVAKFYDVHIHLVAHVKKGDETRRPNRYEIRGSSTIADQADNCIAIWRNKPLEQKLREGGHRERGEFDTILGIDKQRENGIEGDYGLYYDWETCQFVGSVGDETIKYLEYPNGNETTTHRYAQAGADENRHHERDGENLRMDFGGEEK